MATDLDASLGKLQREPGTDITFISYIPNTAKKGVFNLAPSVFRRRYTTTYAPVAIALSEHTPREFRSINAADLNIEFDVVGLSNEDDVDITLAKLRKFIRKDKRTGEPPDLVFQVGPKSWTVRIDTMEIGPKLWNKDGGEQRVHVTLQMHTIEWEK